MLLQRHFSFLFASLVVYFKTPKNSFLFPKPFSSSPLQPTTSASTASAPTTAPQNMPYVGSPTRSRAPWLHFFLTWHLLSVRPGGTPGAAPTINARKLSKLFFSALSQVSTHHPISSLNYSLALSAKKTTALLTYSQRNPICAVKQWAILFEMAVVR